MKARRLSPRTALAVGIGLFVAICAGALVAREVRILREANSAVDTGRALVRLHRDAATGVLLMLGPRTLPMALIEAGFPPRRPVPSLEPRATLVSGKAVVLAERTISMAHYASDTDRLTVFLLPPSPEVIPADASQLKRRDTDLRMLEREGVWVAFWRSGAWVTAVATDAPAAERDALIVLVGLGQGT